jgi:hypothetical protein
MDPRIQIRIRIHTKMLWIRNTAFKPDFNNLNLLRSRQRTEAEGEGKRRAEQERELERLRRILRENTGSHQEKDEVIAGKKLKIMCSSVPDPFETGNAVVAFRSQRPPTLWNLRGDRRSSNEKKQKNKKVFLIHDILVLIRMRILGSVPLTN